MLHVDDRGLSIPDVRRVGVLGDADASTPSRTALGRQRGPVHVLHRGHLVEVVVYRRDVNDALVHDGGLLVVRNHRIPFGDGHHLVRLGVQSLLHEPLGRSLVRSGLGAPGIDDEVLRVCLGLLELGPHQGLGRHQYGRRRLAPLVYDVGDVIFLGEELFDVPVVEDGVVRRLPSCAWLGRFGYVGRVEEPHPRRDALLGLHAPARSGRAVHIIRLVEHQSARRVVRGRVPGRYGLEFVGFLAQSSVNQGRRCDVLLCREEIALGIEPGLDYRQVFGRNLTIVA